MNCKGTNDLGQKRRAKTISLFNDKEQAKGRKTFLNWFEKMWEAVPIATKLHLTGSIYCLPWDCSLQDVTEFLLKKYLLTLCVGMLCLPRRSAHYMLAWWPWRLEEGARYPGIGVRDSCELPCGCWEWNLGLLQTSALNCWAISPVLPLILNHETTFTLCVLYPGSAFTILWPKRLPHKAGLVKSSPVQDAVTSALLSG